jgi:hypothetical protein
MSRRGPQRTMRRNIINRNNPISHIAKGRAKCILYIVTVLQLFTSKGQSHAYLAYGFDLLGPDTSV